MGKKDFPGIYRYVGKRMSGNITCKISFFSDQFYPQNSYAGIIIYGMRGKTNWENLYGKAAGYRGRSFYVIIKDTDSYPDQRAVGNGRVHFYPLEEILGQHLDKNEVLCGGFSYLEGELQFSSVWLNQSDQQIGFDGHTADTDGSKYLSHPKQVSARFCSNQYVQKGPHAIFTVPTEIENKILKFGKDSVIADIENVLYKTSLKSDRKSRPQWRSQSGLRSPSRSRSRSPSESGSQSESGLSSLSGRHSPSTSRQKRRSSSPLKKPSNFYPPKKPSKPYPPKEPSKPYPPKEPSNCSPPPQIRDRSPSRSQSDYSDDPPPVRNKFKTVGKSVGRFFNRLKKKTL